MSLFGSSLVDAAVSTIGAAQQNKWNKEQAALANEYQRQLLAEQNAYNTAEAEKQRQWEAEMSNTAYQRARKDMETAGINPILLGSSAQSASTPTGASANSAASHAAHVPNMVNIITNGMNTGQRSESNDIELFKAIMNGLSKMYGG